MNLLPHLPFWAELLVFVASALVIWVAGIFLARTTDVLADRLHLGQALGGLILLAVATNLPEIAITYSAAASGHLDVVLRYAGDPGQRVAAVLKGRDGPGVAGQEA